MPKCWGYVPICSNHWLGNGEESQCLRGLSSSLLLDGLSQNETTLPVVGGLLEIHI